MVVLVGFDPGNSGHDPGPSHVEHVVRGDAVNRAIDQASREVDVERFSPVSATDAQLQAVHGRSYLDRLAELTSSAVSHKLNLDQDTVVGLDSYDVARRAAGAGPQAVRMLSSGGGDSAFLGLRPPGHHAGPSRAMGFCLVNSVAVTAAYLADAGERVLILDWDAHHGNGTEEIFYADERVLFISLHQYPWFPGTGAVEHIGSGAAIGCTINIPFPAHTAGDAYRLAFDELVVPAAELFSPTWLLVSAGFDAHRDDPLAQLALSAGDFSDLTERAMRLVPPRRRIVFLEGGYDIAALQLCVTGCIASLGGERRFLEKVTSGGRDGLHGAGPDDLPAKVVAEAKKMRDQINPT